MDSLPSLRSIISEQKNKAKYCVVLALTLTGLAKYIVASHENGMDAGTSTKGGVL